MDTYLFSIHPKWCERIFNGEKTIEVRKTAPDDTALANLEKFEQQISINRPFWCPLRTETEIVDKAKEKA